VAALGAAALSKVKEMRDLGDPCPYKHAGRGACCRTMCEPRVWARRSVLVAFAAEGRGGDGEAWTTVTSGASTWGWGDGTSAASTTGTGRRTRRRRRRRWTSGLGAGIGGPGRGMIRFLPVSERRK